VHPQSVVVQRGIGQASVPQISPPRAATGGLIAAPLDPR